jgi:opacity protein-like surface antigen
MIRKHNIMKQILTFCVCICTLSVSGQQHVIKQLSTTQGFGVHAITGIMVLNSDDFESDNESGFNIGLGASYGFSELIEVFAQFQYAPNVRNKIEGGYDYTFSHIGFGARFNSGSTLKAIRPYADISYAITTLNLPFDLYDDQGFYLGSPDYVLTGGALGIGVGVQYYISIPFAIKAEFRINPGTFTNEDLNGYYSGDVDLGFTSFRINAGASYHF